MTSDWTGSWLHCTDVGVPDRDSTEANCRVNRRPSNAGGEVTSSPF